VTTHHHLVPTLRMRGAIPPLTHTSPWRGTLSSTGKTLRLTVKQNEQNGILFPDTAHYFRTSFEE
jgi:hypothetical protein